MKFTRRPDLDPQTHIEIVKHVWLHQGIYGKMVQIAQAYQISRTFLYQLSGAAIDFHLNNCTDFSMKCGCSLPEGVTDFAI
jgi:hypothetical protein